MHHTVTSVLIQLPVTRWNYLGASAAGSIQLPAQNSRHPAQPTPRSRGRPGAAASACGGDRAARAGRNSSAPSKMGRNSSALPKIADRTRVCAGRFQRADLQHCGQRAGAEPARGGPRPADCTGTLYTARRSRRRGTRSRSEQEWTGGAGV